MSSQADPSLEVGHYSLDEDRGIPGALAVQQSDGPYEEGTQPPRLSTRDLTQMDAVVGGQAVRKHQPKENRTGPSLDPKQATHGNPSEGPSAMELGKQVMAMNVGDRQGDSSGLPGMATNQKYQEPSQIPQAGLSSGGRVPDSAGGEKAAHLPVKSSGSVDSGTSQRSGKPEVEVGEAISAVVPNVQGTEDAARAAEQDLQNVIPSTGSQLNLQRVSEESVRPDTAAHIDQQRPATNRHITPEASTSHIHSLLGDSQTAQKQPKGGLPELPPKKRTGTAKTGRKSKALPSSNKTRNRAADGKGGRKSSLHGTKKTETCDQDALEADEQESWGVWLANYAPVAGGLALLGAAGLTAVIIWRKRSW